MAEHPLRIGWASEDITPDRPVELAGQYYQRLALEVRDRLHATALALEGSDESGRAAQAVLISVDVVSFKKDLIEELRGRLKPKMPDFDVGNLVVNAIHTHNAPATGPGRNWWVQDPRAIAPDEYRPFLLGRLEQAAIEAWQRRQPGALSRSLARVSIGHCRRAMYADGSAEMYGKTDRPDFIGMEGNEDSGLDLLYLWSETGELTGVVANWACPAQVMEATYVVTADFVGELRRRLKERFGQGANLLALIAPAGDQSPRDLTRCAKGEADHWNEAGMVEVGRRLDQAVAGEADAARAAAKADVPFQHKVRTIQLPLRRVSSEEHAEAKAILEELQSREPADPASPHSAFNRFVAEIRANEKKGGPGPYDSKLHDFVLMRNNEAVLKRWDEQDECPNVPVELHALRLGDAAVVNNPFELYLDYGHRIRAQSPAQQTFMVQLSGDSLGYLPTPRAVEAGGYGALVINGRIGPEGGDIFVQETLKALRQLWPEQA